MEANKRNVYHNQHPLEVTRSWLFSEQVDSAQSTRPFHRIVKGGAGYTRLHPTSHQQQLRTHRHQHHLTKQ